MQMKNNKGITMMSLIITAIVLVLIAGISFKLGTDSIEQSKKYMQQSSVKIVATAVVQQKGKIDALKLGEVPVSETQPDCFIGTPLLNFSSVSMNKLNEEQKTFLRGKLVNVEEGSNTYKEGGHYDDLYYRVSGTDFEALGITNEGSTFIINYKTGEVYNETLQCVGNKKADVLYYGPAQPNASGDVDNTFAE